LTASNKAASGHRAQSEPVSVTTPAVIVLPQEEC
jgi:hypothetical protein